MKFLRNITGPDDVIPSDGVKHAKFLEPDHDHEYLYHKMLHMNKKKKKYHRNLDAEHLGPTGEGQEIWIWWMRYALMRPKTRSFDGLSVKITNNPKKCRKKLNE